MHVQGQQCLKRGLACVVHVSHNTHKVIVARNNPRKAASKRAEVHYVSELSSGFGAFDNGAERFEYTLNNIGDRSRSKRFRIATCLE